MKVATFSRVSTEDQHTSIINQGEIFEAWINRNGHTLYKSYTDEAISGTKAYKRKEWLRMIEDGKNKKYNILLCKSFSRFGRNMVDTLSAINELRENGIRIIFLEDNLDSEADSTKFGLFSWLAENEAQNTSKRIKTVFQHFNTIGKIHTAVEPYGYDYDINKKNFVINEEEAAVVKKVFKLYLQGNGTNKIANMLTDDNIPSKRGGIWRGNTIKNLISNEIYIGTLVQGKTETIDATIKRAKQIDKTEWIRHYNNHEAIIDEETFVKANKIFLERSKKSKALWGSQKVKQGKEIDLRGDINSLADKSRNSNASLFSNLIVCAECGGKHSIRRKKNRKPYYNCIAFETSGLRCGHSSNFIQEEVLVEYIEQKLNEQVERKFEDIVIVNKNNLKEELLKEIAMVKRQIEKQMAMSMKLLSAYSEDIITSQQYKLQNDSISNITDKLIEDEKMLKDKLNNLPESNEKNVVKSIKAIVKVPINQWNNAMLKEIIDKIEVSINGTIQIYWKIEK